MKERGMSPLEDAKAYHQQVRMVAMQVAGLKPEELAMALAYEVEPFSGVSAGEAEVEYREVMGAEAGVKVYDVAVRRKAKVRGGFWGKLANGEEAYLRVAMIVGAVVVGLVVLDAAWVGMVKARLEKDVGKESVLTAQVERVKGEARAARDEAQAIRARRAAEVAAQDEAAKLRGAYPEILKAIAEACGEKAVVKSIGGGARRVALKAVAVSAEAASEMMVELTAAAGKLGWTLTAGTIQAQGKSPTANFECELRYD